ncbi:MAG: glutamine synthetase family protein, partial [Chloroflexota bacterium]
MNLAEAERYLQDNDIEYVRMEQTDLHGLSRSKTVPVAHFGHFAGNGLNFFGGLLGLDLQSGVAPGTGYMEERQFADQVLRPDLDTLAPIPWVPATAKVIGEPYWYGAGPAEAGPRFVLRRLIDRLGDMGYTLRSGFEYEFYLADAQSREPAFSGIQIFWTLRNNFDQNLMGQLLAGLRGAGLDVITSNAEYGPGQMEINLEPAEGIAAADHAFTFKNAIKEMARLEGYLASFMTKPYSDQSASGCHYHHGLRHARSGANAFVDNRGELSELARHWIGGLLAHAPALASLGSPTVNCGKRFRLFSFAPMNATWGFEDRTAAVRVKGGSPHQTHVENRI